MSPIFLKNCAMASISAEQEVLHMKEVGKKVRYVPLTFKI